MSEFKCIEEEVVKLFQNLLYEKLPFLKKCELYNEIYSYDLPELISIQIDIITKEPKGRSAAAIDEQLFILNCFSTSAKV